MSNSTTVVTDFNTTLAQSLKKTGTETEIALASVEGLSYPGILKLGTGSNSEWMSYTGVSEVDKTITGVTRGIKKNATSFTDADSSIKKDLAIGSAVIMVEHSLSINNKIEKDENGTVSADIIFSGDIEFTGTRKCPVFASLAALQLAYPTPENGWEAFATLEGAYYDASGSVWVERAGTGATQNASDTVAGKVEMATDAEAIAGTETGGTGAKLVVTPKQAGEATQDGSWIYAATSVGTDAYAISLTPAVTAYATGQKFRFKADVACTGACTLDAGAGAVAIKKNVSSDTEDGDIAIGQIVEVVYDGTNFQMVSPSAKEINGANSDTLTDGSNADGLHSHGGQAIKVLAVQTEQQNNASGTSSITFTVGDANTARCKFFFGIAAGNTTEPEFRKITGVIETDFTNYAVHIYSNAEEATIDLDNVGTTVPISLTSTLPTATHDTANEQIAITSISKSGNDILINYSYDVTTSAAAYSNIKASGIAYN